MMSTGGSNPGTMLRHTHSAEQVLWSSSTLGTRTEPGCQPGGGAGTHHPGSLGSRRQPPSVEAKGQTLPSHPKMGPRVDHRHEARVPFPIMESGPLHRPHDPTQLLQARCSPHPQEVSSPSVQAPQGEERASGALKAPPTLPHLLMGVPRAPGADKQGWGWIHGGTRGPLPSGLSPSGTQRQVRRWRASLQREKTVFFPTQWWAADALQTPRTP